MTPRNPPIPSRSTSGARPALRGEGPSGGRRSGEPRNEEPRNEEPRNDEPRIDGPWSAGPAEVLAHLERGDPLDLAGRLTRTVRDRRVLVASEQALPRVRAEVALRTSRGLAFGAKGGSGSERRPSSRELDRWCAAAVEAWLADPHTGTLPRPASTCPAFARLPREVREAFFRVFVEGEPLDRAARALDVDLSTLGRFLRHVLDLFVPPPSSCPLSGEHR